MNLHNQKKKPTLTKTETMKYIEDLLNNASELSYNVSGGKNNLNQIFNANTGSFNSFNYQSVNDAGGYGYFENDEDFNNITQTLIKNISIISPDPEERNYRFQKKFYSVKIDFETPIQRSFKYRRNYSTLTWEANSISEAKNNCRSQSWKHNNANKSYVEIFMKNESDAKRLKNAFEHLAALIKEEKSADRDNDPFGG